eukprot:jgi/Mesvir1/2915/Mv13985-RA.1
MPGKGLCIVCVTAESKYKCPTCRALYCSVACYRKHKETPCSQVALPSQSAPPYAETRPQPPRWYNDENDEDAVSVRLQQKQLQLLAENESIRRALRNKDLQKAIMDIDASISAEQLLDATMQGEAFKGFCERVLGVITGDKPQ